MQSKLFVGINDGLQKENVDYILIQAIVPAIAVDDYLGYAGGRNVTSQADLDLPRSGAASRLLRGNHPIWPEVEAALARWHGAPAALVLNSGYIANEGLLATVIEPHDWVASDQVAALERLLEAPVGQSAAADGVQ